MTPRLKFLRYPKHYLSVISGRVINSGFLFITIGIRIINNLCFHWWILRLEFYATRGCNPIRSWSISSQKSGDEIQISRHQQSNSYLTRFICIEFLFNVLRMHRILIWCVSYIDFLFDMLHMYRIHISSNLACFSILDNTRDSYHLFYFRY